VTFRHAEGRGFLIDANRLQGIPLFADLSDGEREEIASHVHEVEVEAGETLTLEGDNAYELFVIAEGEAEVQREGEAIAHLSTGDVCGEIGVMVTGTRRATVVASTPMRLIAMFARDYRQVERTVPGLATKLRQIMSERPGWSSHLAS
jgi:CRP/FNR family cyclic AMP-dependent transcriptional regulator